MGKTTEVCRATKYIDAYGAVMNLDGGDGDYIAQIGACNQYGPIFAVMIPARETLDAWLDWMVSEHQKGTFDAIDPFSSRTISRDNRQKELLGAMASARRQAKEAKNWRECLGMTRATVRLAETILRYTAKERTRYGQHVDAEKAHRSVLESIIRNKYAV